MTLDDRQRQALGYFIKMGWTPEQSAGIVANLWAESHLNPAAVGDGGRAYGIAQWHPDRQAPFAAIIGHDIHGSTLDEQLAYVHAELQSGERAAGDALQACTTAEAAGATVSRLYERPADREGEATRRGTLAQTILKQYGTAEVPHKTSPPVAPESPPIAPTEGQAMPLLLSLLPAVLNLFAPRAQAALQKITGATPEIAGKFAQDVIAKVQEVTGQPDPIQAVAAITANPKPEVVQQVEDSALDHLDKLMPVLDKIQDYQKQEWDAEEASRDAAAQRMAEAGNYDNRLILTRFGVYGMGIATLLVALLLGVQIYFDIDHKAGGELLAIFIAMVTWIMAKVSTLYDNAYGSSRGSAAKDAALDQLARKV